MIKNIAIVFSLAVSFLASSEGGWGQTTPNITGVNPGFAPVGTEVSIDGSGFGSVQGNGFVTFHGVPAPVVVWSAATLTVTVPAGATTGDLQVTAAGGSSSNTVPFIVTSPLTFFLIPTDSTTSGLKQLSTTTRGTAASFTSPDLANQAAGEYLIQAFDTQAGVPGTSTTLLAGVKVTFIVWMHQVAGTPGTLFPDVKLYLNSQSGTPICSTVGTAAITSTNTFYSLACAPGADITVGSADRYYLWVGVDSTTASTSSLQAQMGIGSQVRGQPQSEVTVPFH